MTLLQAMLAVCGTSIGLSSVYTPAPPDIDA